jgi:hypothetical protein
MISIETHRNLYRAETNEDIKASLDYAKSLSVPESKEPVTFHFYWRVPKEFGRKQVLPIKSAIVTQDLSRTKIILWSNIDLSRNKFVQPLLPYIQTKIWNPVNESIGTPLEGSSIFRGTIDDPRCYLGGDLFRLLCLYKYGGVYIDMDMVVLRDFSPILSHEFMYQWGTSGWSQSEPFIFANGAAMRLKSQSKLARDLLEEVQRMIPQPNSTSWGKDLYMKVRERNKDYLILPCTWFNTEWCSAVGDWHPFIKSDQSNHLYDGAFTWHWHNRWDHPIEDGCKFQILEKMAEDKFLAMK